MSANNIIIIYYTKYGDFMAFDSNERKRFLPVRKSAIAKEEKEKKEEFSFDIEEDKESSLPEEELKRYLAIMKALQNYYQHAHWISKGDPFYGDHLLFERLYNSLFQEIDSLAEKMVGLGGDHFVCIKAVMSITSKILEHVPEMTENTLGYELAQSGLKMEKLFLAYTKKIYSKMKEDKSITLGFDDLLMSFYNSHEGNVYLLKQRVKTS
jgi:DNA-binding ferritin-like protein